MVGVQNIDRRSKTIVWETALDKKSSEPGKKSRIKIIFCFNKPVHEIRTGNQD